MNQENQELFFQELRRQLSPLPPEERERYIEDYREMLLDRIEDGMPEEEAIRSLGAPEEIAGQILQEVPIGTLIKARVTPKRKLSGWEITLLILGFPLWFPLLIAAAAVLFSFFIVICALLISLTAVGIGFIVAGPAAEAAGIVQLCHQMTGEGLATIGAGLFLLGLGILFFIAGVKLFGVFFRWLGRFLRGIFLKKKEEK